jgi:hypothetical protein
MISWFKRLVRDERLERANQKLDEQYKGLDEMGDELDKLCKKLDRVDVATTESMRAGVEVQKTVSGSMRAVKLEEFPNEEAPTNPLFRRKLQSGT